MSNLVKALSVKDTGNRKFIKENTSQLFQDVFSAREDTAMTHYPEIAKLYKISVTLGNTCAVPDYESHMIGEAINRTKEQVIEAVFGEFRQDFRMIERHLYNYEFEQAATALRNMERRMFTDE